MRIFSLNIKFDKIKKMNTNQEGARKSLQVIIENCEYAKHFHYFVTIELEGDNVKRRTDISAQVTNPVFSTNKFYIPVNEVKLQRNANLIIKTFVVTQRIDQMTEEQIFGAAKLLGTCMIDLNPLMPQLVDVYSVGVKKKIEFVRQSSSLAGDGKAPVVGRGICGLKMVGDYLSKFDLPGDGSREGGPLGPPKRSHGEIHVLPADSLNFKWRLRIDAKAALDLPVSN